MRFDTGTSLYAIMYWSYNGGTLNLTQPSICLCMSAVGGAWTNTGAERFTDWSCELGAYQSYTVCFLFKKHICTAVK